VSGGFALALAGAFLAGAVCTGCLGAAVVFVANQTGGYREFDDGRAKIERVFPDGRGEWKGDKGWPGYGLPQDKQGWPAPQDKGVWPAPDGMPGWPAPAPEQKRPPVPAPSTS
jgi:hypothetical protein